MGLSNSSLLVLKSFMERPATPLSGADVLRVAGLRSGTLYPILLRLERQGLLTSKWEEGQPEKLGRPRRRYYSLTPDGAAAARSALEAMAASFGVFLPNLEPAS